MINDSPRVICILLLGYVMSERKYCPLVIPEMRTKPLSKSLSEILCLGNSGGLNQAEVALPH